MHRDEHPSPRALLDHDHRVLDALLDRVVATVRSDDREAGTAIWSELEASLLRHFDVEEMLVFPALAARHAAEVTALQQEHAEIRQALGEIGISFDLHLVRAEAIESLCERLRAHAAREANLAYEQAGESLDAPARAAIARRLRSTSAPADAST